MKGVIKTTLMSLAAAVVALAGAPAAKAVSFEIGFDAGALYSTSHSLDPLMEARSTFMPGAVLRLRVGDIFAAHAGARLMTFEASQPAGYNTTLDVIDIVAGASARVPIVWRLYAFGQVDLVAQTGELELSAGGWSGSQRAWGFGATPTAGLELDLPIEDALHIHIRVYGGFAFRTDLAFDGLATGSGRRAVDLGSANLSGVTWGLTAALSF